MSIFGNIRHYLFNGKTTTAWTRTNVILDDFTFFNIIGLIGVHGIFDFNQGSYRVKITVSTLNDSSVPLLYPGQTGAIGTVLSTDW